MSAKQEECTSYFAPAERAKPAELRELAQRALDDPVITTVLECVDGNALILNKQRQIIAMSPGTLKALGLPEVDAALGLRPGELLRCSYANEGPGGCGTGRHCGACGAVAAILNCLNTGAPTTNECVLSMEGEGQLLHTAEFRVRATQVQLGGQTVIIFVLHDISAEKRRAVMERVFFHDVNNTLTGLLGWSNLLHETKGEQAEVTGHIVRLVKHLARDINDQRDLLLAERGELALHLVTVDALDVFLLLRAFFDQHPVAEERRLEMECTDNSRFTTDVTLLMRVLTNMVKNALEATAPGGAVRCWFTRRDGRPTFVVQNAGRIPGDVAGSIFQRSFSTKNQQGRGLGTYSMKLFGEQYLRGKVTFTSSEDEGTQFSIELPVE